MNFKYPNLITGSIAASAPIFLLTTDEDRTFFFNGVTKDFADATPNCEPKVRQAFIEVKNLAEKGAPGDLIIYLMSLYGDLYTPCQRANKA